MSDYLTLLLLLLNKIQHIITTTLPVLCFSIYDFIFWRVQLIIHINIILRFINATIKWTKMKLVSFQNISVIKTTQTPTHTQKLTPSDMYIYKNSESLQQFPIDL